MTSVSTRLTLSLYAGACDSCNEILLEHQEYDNYRNKADAGGGHDETVLCGILRYEHLETDLKSFLALRG